MSGCEDIMCYQYENEFEWQVFLWRKCVYGIFTCMLRLYHVFLYTSAICGPLAQWRSRGLIIPWLQVRVLQGPPATETERLLQAFRFLFMRYRHVHLSHGAVAVLFMMFETLSDKSFIYTLKIIFFL